MTTAFVLTGLYSLALTLYIVHLTVQNDLLQTRVTARPERMPEVVSTEREQPERWLS